MMCGVRANDSLMKTPQVAIAFRRIAFISYNGELAGEFKISLKQTYAS